MKNIFRVIAVCFASFCTVSSAYSEKLKYLGNDPAIDVCLRTEAKDIEWEKYKIYRMEVSKGFVVLNIGNEIDKNEPMKLFICIFLLNKDDKYEMELSSAREEKKLEQAKKDIEYLNLTSSDPGFETYQKKVEEAGAALIKRKLWIRDANELLSKLDYYPIDRNITKLVPMKPNE